MTPSLRTSLRECLRRVGELSEIHDVARRFALANFMAFAPDGLTSLGGFPGDDYNGGLLFNKVNGPKMTEDMVAAAMWLKFTSVVMSFRVGE